MGKVHMLISVCFLILRKRREMRKNSNVQIVSRIIHGTPHCSSVRFLACHFLSAFSYNDESRIPGLFGEAHCRATVKCDSQSRCHKLYSVLHHSQGFLPFSSSLRWGGDLATMAVVFGSVLNQQMFLKPSGFDVLKSPIRGA